MVIQSKTGEDPHKIAIDFVVQKRPLIALKFNENSLCFFKAVSIEFSLFWSYTFTADALKPLILVKTPTKYSSALTSEMYTKGYLLTFEDI